MLMLDREETSRWEDITRSNRSVDVKRIVTAIAALVFLALAPRPAQAQGGFLVPYLGANFGGDSGCQRLSGCKDKTLNYGVALGKMGAAGGFEEDIGYARNFFGETPDGGSSVLVLMSNLVLGPSVGPVRPYLVGGVGLIKSHVDFDVSSIVSTTDNNLGYDLGLGLTVGAGHLGVRGDLRRFKTFGDLSLGSLPISGESLNFWRATAGIYLGF
jgi:Outer membrane protein beta-barrel domain